MSKTVATYGSWKSPFSSELIVSKAIGFGTVVTDGNDIYWIETRPQEGGRHVVVKRSPDGSIADITPADFYSRTRVHEYGGGAYGVKSGDVFFSNYSDQRIYRQTKTSQPTPLSPQPKVHAGLRFAEIIVDNAHSRLIAVCEDHTTGSREASNSIVSVSFDGKITPLCTGHDFYSFPKLSADGSMLAWIEWDHPNMPWDGTTLKIATVNNDGSLSDEKTIAGGPSISIVQPEWGIDNDLFFVSDESDWWNLYWYDGKSVTALHPIEAEFGRPQWHLGYSQYAVLPSGNIICSYNQGAHWRLATINIHTKAFKEIKTEYTDIWWLKSAGNKIVFRGASPSRLQEMVCFDPESSQFEVLKSSSPLTLDKTNISIPRAIEFPTNGNVKAHAFYYPPTNNDFTAPPGEQPPLLVKSHGGPTGSLSVLLNLELQYWTSRGFAVLDVNYRGSTGYGRKYRELLYGNWGIVDVDDCENAALTACKQGLADSNRLAIDGVSAGGYTTLCALVFKKTFSAGASYYGVAELIHEATETHKFESKSLDRLIAPYPDREDIYRARSPLEHVDILQTPVIFFQGLEDKIVPPNQTLLMVEALRKRKKPVAYLTFEHEQHGFRQAETIKRSLDCEFYFYSRIFGFKPADAIEPIPIENL